MRSILSSLLLIAYLGLILRPSMPLLEYELRKDFIAAELCVDSDEPASCCKGSCYLDQRLKEAAGEQHPNSDVEKQITVPLHLLVSILLPKPETSSSPRLSPQAFSCHGVLKTPPTPPPQRFV